MVHLTASHHRARADVLWDLVDRSEDLLAGNPDCCCEEPSECPRHCTDWHRRLHDLHDLLRRQAATEEGEARRIEMREATP